MLFAKEIVIFLLVMLLISISTCSYKSVKLEGADAKREKALLDLKQEYEIEAKRLEDLLFKASVDLEVEKNTIKKEVEVVTREVQKIVDRPIYIRECIDDDGMQQLNSLITKSSSKSAN